MAPYFLKPFVPYIGQVCASSDKGRGWGQHIEWLELGEGLQRAASERKPMMVIIHKRSCPICQRLRAEFSQSNEIQQLSSRFAMVNLEPEVDVIPSRQDFAPDGRYVPRILFFTPDGVLMEKASNVNKKHLFNYTQAWEVLRMMKMVLEQ